MSRLRWTVIPYETPFTQPLLTAHGVWSHRRGFWVVCEDDAGLQGLGEAAPLPDWGTESVEAAAVALNALPALEGDVLSHLDITRTPAAFAAAETALLDLESRRSGVSLATRLAAGRPVRPRVAVNTLLKSDRLEGLVQEAHSAWNDGFRAFKLKVGARPAPQDLARVAAVRAAIGPDAELRLDANGGWSRDEAIALLQSFAPYHPAYVEQPVSAADLEGLAHVEAATGVHVAADEAVRDLDSARRLFAAGVKVLVVKPLAVGGLGVSLAIAEAARQAGARLVWTSVLDRGIGTAAVLHLAAVGQDDTAAGLDVGNLFTDGPALEGLMPVSGHLTVPPGPGLGLAPRAPELMKKEQGRDGTVSLR